MAAFPRRHGTSFRNLDRSQKPRVLHESKEVKSQASLLVLIPSPFRFRHASPTRQKHGETRRFIPTGVSQPLRVLGTGNGGYGYGSRSGYPRPFQRSNF